MDFYDDATKVTINFSSTEHWVQKQHQPSHKMLLIIKLTYLSNNKSVYNLWKICTRNIKLNIFDKQA